MSQGEENDKRVEEFEAKISFVERELDHLRAQVMDMWKDFAALSKRVDILQRCLDAKQESTDS